MSQMNWRIVFCMCNQLFDLYCLVRIAKTCFAKFCFFSRHTNWQRMSADWHRTSLGRGKFNLSGLIIIIFIIIKKDARTLTQKFLLLLLLHWLLQIKMNNRLNFIRVSFGPVSFAYYLNNKWVFDSRSEKVSWLPFLVGGYFFSFFGGELPSWQVKELLLFRFVSFIRFRYSLRTPCCQK